jgi:hypothetical protein
VEGWLVIFSEIHRDLNIWDCVFGDGGD